MAQTLTTRVAVASVGALLAVTTSCTAEDSSSSGHTAEPSTATPADRDRCLRRQKGAYTRVFDTVQSLTQVALSRPEDVPAAAVERVKRRLSAVPDLEEPRCDAPLMSLRKAVEALEPGVLDEVVLRRVIDEVDRWVSAREPRYPPILYAADPCVPLRRHTQVTYDVDYRSVPQGREGWVVMTLANGWDRAITLEHWGTAEVTGHRNGARRYEWGASSGDVFAVGPDRTRSNTDMIPFKYLDRVPLTSDGRIHVGRVGAAAYIPAIPGYCDLPVRRSAR